MSSSTRCAWSVRHSQDFPSRAQYMYEKHFHDANSWPLCCISPAPAPSAIAFLHEFCFFQDKWLKRTHEALNFWNSRNLKSRSHIFKFIYITGPGHDLAGIALHPASFLCPSRKAKSSGEDPRATGGLVSNLAKSSAEDPKATGGLVSNLPHPRVNKTEHHTFALRHSNDCIVRCLPEKRYNRRTSSSGEEPWPVVAGSVFYILVQRSCTSFLSDSGGGNHCFWQALWVHCTEIHRSETPPTPCYYLLLLSQSVLTRHGG